MSPKKCLLGLAYAALLAAVWVGLLNTGCRNALRVDPVRTTEEPPLADGLASLARLYAPFILHEADPEYGRQDIPTRVDFDGNFRGDDNWESFAHFELPPTVYYAVVETDTHWFLTYHLFHPRDWAPLRLGLNDTHENDGENLQIVVRKADGRPELLFTQAHFEGRVYGGAGFADGEVSLSGDFVRVDGATRRPAEDGLHAVVWVEAEGHGIFGTADSDARARLGADGSPDFDRAGVLYRPAAPGEAVEEPGPDSTTAAYRLESTRLRMWPLVRAGAGIGFGGLFDGAVEYTDERVAIALPRYYEADRFSGPLGSDRGISPFAVDFGFEPPQLGALFFDPANRYAQVLGVKEPWALDYLDYPYRPLD